MNKSKICLLALLLVSAVLLGLTACGSDSGVEPTEKEIVIRVPEPVEYESCTDMGTPLADVRVRRALALAVDVDSLVEALYWETGEAAGMEGWDYDPQQAKELLAEAGWPSDYVLDVVYYQDDTQTEDLLHVVVQYWEAVGIQAKIRKLEEDVAEQLWTAPEDPEADSAVKWDLAVCAVSDLMQQHYLERFASESSRNSHTPAVEGLDQAIAAGDVQGMKAILAEQLFCIPLLYQDGFICVSEHLDTADMVPGNDRFAYDKDILNWVTDREDNTLYTGEVPAENELCPATDPGNLYHELVFDCLIAADSSLEPGDGGIAESYTFAANGLTGEFVIPEGLLWHDGEPLTAVDVKFTFELYLQCPDLNPVLTDMLEKLVGAKDFVNGDAEECTGIVVEENKVIFHFRDRAEDAQVLFSQWPILPKHKLEKVKPAKLLTHKFWKAPIGSGPFKVAQLEPGKTCLLERWEDYRQTGEGNIDFVRMNAGEIAVLAAREMLDYGWGMSTDDGTYIAGLDHMELMTVERACALNIFINQYPHESYFTLEENTEPTE